MSDFKTYGAIAIMIGCFVVIYPRFMHPIFLSMFGVREAQPKPTNFEERLYPPGYKGNPSGSSRGGPEDVRKHMRPGPHPGMRAAAEMQRQQGHQGSSRGMMGIVLPMYAVGIVLYLGYTLYKVFNKTYTKDKSSPAIPNHFKRDKARYYRERERERDSMGFPKDFDGTESIHNFLQDENHRQNLEDLLARVDDKNVSVDEMRVLQKRLEETEAQMTRILSAMHAVHANVDTLKTQEMASNEEGDENEKGEKSQSAEKTKEDESKEPLPSESSDTIHVDAKDKKTKETTPDQEPDQETEESNVSDEPGIENGAEVEEESSNQLLEEMHKEDGDDAKESAVRHRNVKSSEQ